MLAKYGSLRPHRYFWILLGLIAFFGMLLASATLGWSLSTDEPFTANTVHGSWAAMWGAFAHDNVAPLHYLLLWGWVRLFGESEIALRLPSLIFFGATIVVVGRTAQRLARSRAGLMAALLLAISTNMGHAHATSARPYALLSLIIALATHVTLIALPAFPTPPAHPRRWHMVLIGLHTLGLMTHSLYAFALAALTLAALWVSRRAFIQMVINGAAASALYLLFYGSLQLTTILLPTTAWMPTPDLKDWADGFLNLWGAQKTLAIGLYLVALIGVGAWRRLNFRAALTQPATLVCLTGFAFIGVVPFLISQIKPVYIESRTPALFLPFACVLVAVLFRRFDHRLLSLGVLVVLSVAAALSAYQLWRGPERVPARASLQTVAAQVQCGDVLVLGSLSLSEVRYYFRQFHVPECVVLETFPLDTATHPGWLDGVGLLADLEGVREEAEQTTVRLSQSVSRIWLFHDSRFYPAVGEVIHAKFNQHFTPVETLDVRGSFFDSVVLYLPSR